MKTQPQSNKGPFTTKRFPVGFLTGIRKLTGNGQANKDIDTTVDDLLRTLVAFPTVSDNIAANQGAVKYIEQYLKATGMYTEYHEFDGHPALWATTRVNQKHPKVLLAAHVDVIPAGKESFSLRIEGDRYYGRGVMDMKCAIAAYLKAVANLEGPLKHYDFGIMITSDEELGGRDGVNSVERLIEDGYGADFVVLPDGGNNWQFEDSSKGYLHFTLSANGKAAHSSRPWEGDNALSKLVAALHELEAPFKDQGPTTSTINIGAISGGEVANKIPGYASAEISFRPIDKQAMIDLADFVEKTCAKHGVKAHSRAVFQPIVHSFEEPHLKKILNVVEQVRGERPTGIKSHGGSDARFFMEAGTPVAVFYPIGNGHHSNNEWLEIKSLHQMEEIFTRYLKAEATT